MTFVWIDSLHEWIEPTKRAGDCAVCIQLDLDTLVLQRPHGSMEDEGQLPWTHVSLHCHCHGNLCAVEAHNSQHMHTCRHTA